MGGTKIITVSLPAELLDVLDHYGRWHNRSALIRDALERYIRLEDPSLYKLLLIERGEEIG